MTANQRSRDNASMISCGIASARMARSGSAPSGVKGRIAIEGLPRNCSRRPPVSSREVARAGADVVTSPLPDGLHDLVLGDHPAMVPDEMDQQGKHLGLERHGNAVARELEQLRVEMKVSERPGHEQFYTKPDESYRKSSDCLQAPDRASR